MNRFTITLLAGLVFAPAAAWADDKLDNVSRILLQTTMQHSVAERTINGQFRYLDMKDGEIKHLYPAKSHPMILQFGDHFILCSSFRDMNGKDVNIDFYVARSGDEFVVVDTKIAERELVKSLMKAGKAAIAH